MIVDHVFDLAVRNDDLASADLQIGCPDGDGLYPALIIADLDVVTYFILAVKDQKHAGDDIGKQALGTDCQNYRSYPRC